MLGGKLKGKKKENKNWYMKWDVQIGEVETVLSGIVSVRLILKVKNWKWQKENDLWVEGTQSLEHRP